MCFFLCTFLHLYLSPMQMSLSFCKQRWFYCRGHQQVLRHPPGGKTKSINLIVIHVLVMESTCICLVKQTHTFLSLLCFELIILLKLTQTNPLQKLIKPFGESNGTECQLRARDSVKHFIDIASLVHKRSSWGMPYCSLLICFA